MNALRVALATAALLVCAGFSGRSDAPLQVQYTAPQQIPQPPAGSREPKASERDPKGKERTPPPRPIVPPEGQQENPALREECAWLGQRMISLLFRDDAMTSNDFMPFYQRFGCPEQHFSKAFGCIVSSGSLENDALADRVAQCWTDPSIRRPAVPSEDAEPSNKATDRMPEKAPNAGAEKPGGDGLANSFRPVESGAKAGYGGSK